MIMEPMVVTKGWTKFGFSLVPISLSFVSVQPYSNTLWTTRLYMGLVGTNAHSCSGVNRNQYTAYFSEFICLGKELL